MSIRPIRPLGTQEFTFDDVCARLDAALTGTFRRRLVDDLSASNNLGQALLRLRESMRANVWRTADARVDLDKFVRAYDSRTREEGFHALNDWDGIADHVNEDIIPVDVLHYLVEKQGRELVNAVTLAILVDYYFMHVLSLLALRVWDEGDADANLDRVAALLRRLQGPDGSGQPFATDAETLILIATSHYERREEGYEILLERTRGLNAAHQLNIAIGHAASMGSHLRFGFEATYARDTMKTRDDNVADYPWLCFALVTLMREYARMDDEGIRGAGRDLVVEALMNGLSPDAKAFVGDHPPASLSGCAGDRADLRELFWQHRQNLLEEGERFRPSGRSYSPLSFFFNFSHNVLKGIVIDALVWGEVRPLSFNDLLTGAGDNDATSAAKLTLAKTLMAYARANPHMIRGKLMPVIVYDPDAGRRAFGLMMRRLRE
ncbi:MAG TPA: hypothetical protein VND92_04375 [Vicinamibacterales bacterium]|nr:hypothetical protein [Vicinamibacterales bacterium]